MRFQKNLPGLMMLASGFACGVIVTLLFGHQAGNPTLLEHPRASSPREVGWRLDCNTKSSSCVCDKEAEKLKRLARLVFVRSQLTLNQSCITDSAPPLSAENVTDLKTFLYPDNLDHFSGVPLGVPKFLRQEYHAKEPLLIGILTQREYLHTRAQAVYDTWAQDIGQVVFFVGEDCDVPANLSHLPIIKLNGIQDHVYPPLKKAFAVMQYMYDHFIDQYNWFIRADDDMYVRGELLMDLLDKLSPYERVYLGRAGVGRDDDLDRLHLLPHERYCMGGPGVVFSYAAMKALGPHLNQCLSAVILHDEHSSQKWNDDDVEIGRCISRKLQIQCSTSAESRLKFHTDYAGDSLQPLTLWSKPIFRDVISMHPVKDPLNMHAIHHFYKTLEFELQYERLFDLASYTNELCKSLPQHLVPPGFVSTGCNLKLTQNTPQESVGWSGSYLVNRSTAILANPTDIYDETHWSFFTRDTMFGALSVSPQHSIRLPFQAELNHLTKLLQLYFTRRKGDMKDCTFEEIVYGYTRFLPATGREFLLRIKLKHSGSVQMRTVRLLRRLSPDIAISVETGPTSKPIHVLLPLVQVDARFREFLKNFVQMGLGKGVSLSLVVVLFSELNADSAESIVKQFTHGFPKAMVTIAIAEGQYSFPRAVEAGMSVLDKHDLVFVADVNIRVRHDFWERCRENTELGTQVYFSIPFSVYELDYRTTLVNNTFSYPVNTWTGMWAFHTFRTFCIFKQDYADVGGYEGAKFSVNFFERVMHSKIHVFQAPDPGLYQFWSATTCENLSSVSKKESCLKLQVDLSQFPRPELTEFLLGQSKSKVDKFWSQNISD